MTKERLLEDKEYMEQVMCRTADHCDIWQDRFIYMMARSIFDILDTLIRMKNKEKVNEMQTRK